MSIHLINEYYSKVDKIKQYSGSKNETAIRDAFKELLQQYCESKHLYLISELSCKTKYSTFVTPDGTIKDALRQDWGYWESKDEYDDIDEEIKVKINKGYPTNNILFEDGQTAILYQEGTEFLRVDIKDHKALHQLITAFVSYEPKEVQTFHDAIERFKKDLPALTDELRSLIGEQEKTNKVFETAQNNFLELCRKSINPNVVIEDVREMLIQHILTEDIFITVFNNAQYHKENNISHEMGKLADTFFTGEIRQNIVLKINPYISIIKAAASNIADHHEKQKFLKVFYENFYKAYSPAKADRLGIIYTPNEIVDFMIRSTDYLLEKHFEGRTLADKNVEILDPAAGTGTYITELIEYIPNHLLPYKYTEEIHCNEVAILPYYVANLNIEYTYAQKMGEYKEFKNICFVDTLDNMGFGKAGEQYNFFSISDENLDRIKNQNERKISVIIGNPPYNANQLNENENNKNREYPRIDKRIKDTYIKHSTAQKTKLYDMYSRFIRWASDRLDENGILVFVSNNSFINARTYDGFRKAVADEFSHIYIIDMKGDARTSGERRKKEGGNVFNDAIRVGVAIYFMVRKKENQDCHIYYTCVDDYITSESKRAYLNDNSGKFNALPFKPIHPDKNNNWINLTENEWDSLIPVANNTTKKAKSLAAIDSIFKIYSTGISTNRDEWIVGLSPKIVEQRMRFFINFYNDFEFKDEYETAIKWSRNLKQRYHRGIKEKFQISKITEYSYRPYCKHYIYKSELFIDEMGNADRIFPYNADNIVISIINPNGSKTFNILATKYFVDLHFTGDTQYLSQYCYDEHGRLDNITDWALKLFQENYQDETITKENIFRYVYAVLNNPAYQKKYAINLKREFPRIPFYTDFWKWANYGKKLIELHVNYETVKPYLLKREDKKYPTTKAPPLYKAKLKADKIAGTIELDTITTLKGIPQEAWQYKLGNRSAVEWVLEYYKERNPKDPTIKDKFNTYRFVDYKEQVIDLLQKVCTVSVETIEILNQMTINQD